MSSSNSCWLLASASFWKEVSLLLTVSVCTMSSYQILTNAGAVVVLSTWKLSRAVDNGGCTPNRRRHHGHRPVSSCQSLKRRGFCAHVNLGVLPMNLAEALCSSKPALCPRCPPCVTASLYHPHYTFWCVIDINLICCCLWKLTMIIWNMRIC